MPKTLQNGSFEDANGTTIANGTLVLTLSQDAQIIAGGNVNARDLISIALDVTGNVSGSPSVFGQDELSPASTYYTAEVLNSGGSSVWGPTKWVISGASPINLNLMVPTLLNPDPAYSQPLLMNPVGDQTVKNNSILPASGNVSQALGSVAAPWLVVAKTISMTGLLTNYNGIATVLNGSPAEYAAVSLSTQSAAIAPTVLYTPIATAMYRISAYLKVVTAAGTSSTLGPITVGYTDGGDSVAQSNFIMLSNNGAAATTSTGNTTTTVLTGSMIIYAKTGVAILYSVGYASNAANAMVYEIRMTLEQL